MLLREKYRSFPFMFLPDRRLVRRIVIAPLLAISAMRRGDHVGAGLEMLDAASLVAEGAVTAVARADLVTRRRRRPEAVRPRRPEDALVGGELPPGPLALIVGDPLAVGALASAMRLDARVGSPPAGLLPTSVAAWTAPSGSARELLRKANCTCWALPVERAVQRLEALGTRTQGEAVLGLHAILAWLGRKGVWVAAAGGDAGPMASSFLPSVPVVVIGATTGAVGREPPMAIPVEDLVRDPSGTVHRLAPLLGLAAPERVATALTPLSLTRRRRMRTQ